jgi:hypothetical protein
MHPLETSSAPSNAPAENFLDCGLFIRLCLNIRISHNPALYINRAIHQPHAAAKLLGEKLRRGRIQECYFTQVQYHFLMIAPAMIDQQRNLG